jgi:hypothetical protein
MNPKNLNAVAYALMELAARAENPSKYLDG